MKFENKVVLITGASSGFGKRIAIKFANSGAQTAIVDRNAVGLEHVLDECQKNGNKHISIKADLTQDSEVKNVIDTVIDTFGKLDVLVNNAGILRDGSILDGKVLDVYDEVININLRAVIHLTTMAAPYLIKTKGNVVNISSADSKCTPASPGYISYGVSKAGVDHFTRCAALELAASGIRVNSVNPGYARTMLLESAGFKSEDVKTLGDNFIETLPIAKAVEPEEVADLVMFLASDDAKSITGSHHVIDSGYLLSK